MFWKKSGGDGQSKLAGPKGIPELVGRHLVCEAKKNPDWVWNLKAVSYEVAKNQFYCRVFDDIELSKANVNVKDWTSLDNHPELVVWEGFVDKGKLEAKPQKMVKPAA